MAIQLTLKPQVFRDRIPLKCSSKSSRDLSSKFCLCWTFMKYQRQIEKK